MAEAKMGTQTNPVRVECLHQAHPKIRAADWRSPLISKLLSDAPYSDGTCTLAISYRADGSVPATEILHLGWTGLDVDYNRCIRTYQETVLTEFAALAVACILCHHLAGQEITEVTRRGEKVDYWLGDRELLLEVSGTSAGDLDQLCADKASHQLQKNPFQKDGFVCVARFTNPTARLWHYVFPKGKAS